MDDRSLELFLHLSGSLHFGRTGNACNLSPSALSRTIKRLEEELGVTLFVRDKRSVALTDAGRKLREYARERFDGWEQFRETLLPGDNRLQGEIVVYCSVTAAETVLSDIFVAYRKRHPAVHIRLQTGDSADAVDRILDGTADLTVAARPDALPKSVEFLPLVTTPLLFIAPRIACEVSDMVGESSVPWRTVPMILADRALSRKRADEWFRAARVRANIYAEVAGHEAIIAMVRLGCGVGVVPRLVLEQSALKEEVRVLEVSPPLAPYYVGVCAFRRRLQSPAVRAFWDIAAENQGTGVFHKDIDASSIERYPLSE